MSILPSKNIFWVLSLVICVAVGAPVDAASGRVLRGIDPSKVTLPPLSKLPPPPKVVPSRPLPPLPSAGSKNLPILGAPATRPTRAGAGSATAAGSSATLGTRVGGRTAMDSGRRVPSVAESPLNLKQKSKTFGPEAKGSIAMLALGLGVPLTVTKLTQESEPDEDKQ